MYGTPGGPGAGLAPPGLAMTGTYFLGPTVMLAAALILAGLLLYRFGRVRNRTFD
jgi:hypothetical protein